MKKESIKKTMTYLHIWTFISIIFIGIIFSFSSIYVKNPSIIGFAVYESPSSGSTINDTYIRDDFPNNNFGTATSLRIGQTSGTNYRSLIEDLNISTIPSANTVTNAKLQIYVTDAYGNSNITIKAYRVTSEWLEPNATWNNRTGSILWNSAGGDYNSNELDTINITNQSGTYYNLTILDAVKGWVNSSYNNYGIILIASDAEAGNYSYLASSNHTTEAFRPKFIIDHSSNAAPGITNISTDTSLTNPKLVGDQVNITVNWSDPESQQCQLFICNSSAINTSGCNQTTLCNTSYESSGPSSCLYTIQSSDNRTTNFWAAVCDSSNCSAINQSYFYINHAPEVVITDPNGGETVNQSQGNYIIEFNSSDSDTADQYSLTANIYYGASQNSTTNLIDSNINLTHGANCTDTDANPLTPNSCTYSWNSSQIYGTFYLTIIINDSFTLSNDSSDSGFDIRSLSDQNPPNITAQWIESGITSGKEIQIYANVSDSFLNTVWISINTTPQTNLTLTNTTAGIPNQYNITWTAIEVGNYQFKVWANDTVGNVNNSMSWQTFNISKPNATSQNETAPSTALPYHTIKITTQLNATDPLKNIYAYLNTPSSFTFLSDYLQNLSLGNFTSNQTKTATWFLSVPFAEATYSTNVTYTDDYSNQWNSSNIQIEVTSAIGGYEISMAGYPEVETSGSYFSQAYFKQNGVYTNPDAITISVYDAAGGLTWGPASMTQESTGIYNYSNTVGASVTEGQWETIINATKSSTSYFTHEFWKVVGGPFDVRDINIISSAINTLNISVLTENTGGANKDLTLEWNLSRIDTGEILDSASETRMVPANSELTWYVSPSTTYIGQVKITFLGYYSGTEKAGAYETFTTTSGNISCGDGTCNGDESCSTCPQDCGTCPSEGGGGGGGGAITTPKEKKSDFKINIEDPIYLTKNIEKIVYLEIENTGKETLNNLILELTLDKNFYTISPEKITSIKPGEKKKFQINFLITNFMGEYKFKYKIKSEKQEKEKSGKIIVTSIEEFLKKEIERLKNKANELRNQIKDKKALEDLSKCEEIISELELNLKKEEFINAKDNLLKADNCLNNIKPEIKKEIPTPETKMELIWTIALLLLALVVIILGFVIYLLYKKVNVFNFLNKKQGIASSETDKTSKEQIFEEKLKNIEEKLNP